MKIQLNQFVKPILFTLLGMAIALFLFKGCDSQQVQQVNLKPVYDTLKNHFVELNKMVAIHKKKAETYKLQADSLKLLKSKVYVKYFEKKELVLNETTDNLIVNLLNYCDSLNMVNSEIISKQDSEITELSQVAFKQDSQIQNLQTQIQLKDIDLLTEIDKTKFVKKELRRQKIKTWGVGILVAIGLGFALSR